MGPLEIRRHSRHNTPPERPLTEHSFTPPPDRYRLDREVGRGGMATVYLAHDVRHGRSVAIKVLNPEVSADIGRDRFLREIAIAARLNHPRIVPLFDSGAPCGRARRSPRPQPARSRPDGGSALRVTGGEARSSTKVTLSPPFDGIDVG